MKGINYLFDSNKNLYLSRYEPKITKKEDPGSYYFAYHNLRTCKHTEVFEGLERILDSNKVLIAWIASPFNKIMGYGIYTKDQAEILIERNAKESWVFPKVGSKYTLEDIVNRKKELE